MPKKLQRYLKDYLSKERRPPPQIPFPSRKWIRSGCKHPKTLSFAINRDRQNDSGHEDDAASLSDIDQFLFENFRSLYLRDDEDVGGNNERSKEGCRPDHHHQSDSEVFWDETLKLKKGDSDYHPTEIFWDNTMRLKKTGHPDDHHLEETQKSPGVEGDFFQSPRFHIDPPAVDLCGSHRFFVSPCRASSSVMEEARTSTTTTSEDVASSSMSTLTLNDSSANSTDHAKDGVTLPNDCIAVLAYSPSPYDDFRRSMRDMVESRVRNHANVDWNFMEELLFCYLNLNEKKSYRFILSAFADLIVDLRQNSDRSTSPKF